MPWDRSAKVGHELLMMRNLFCPMTIDNTTLPMKTADIMLKQPKGPHPYFSS
jgi:hypothetical protein